MCGIDAYKKIGKIGEGTYGAVYNAENWKTKQKVVIKKMKQNDNDDDIISSYILREIAFLKENSHPHIANLLDVCPPDSSKSWKIVLEHGGDTLCDVIKKEVSIDQCKSWMRQLCQVILFMNQRGYMHRDLKPQNIVVNGDHLKVVDFGQARQFSVPCHNLTQEISTLWFRSPEILLGAKSYTTATETWSIGTIFYNMLTTKVLFSCDSEIEMLYSIFRITGTPTNETWSGVQDLPNWNESFPKFESQKWKDILPSHDVVALDLLEKMIQIAPSKRISLKDALNHPFLLDQDFVIPSITISGQDLEEKDECMNDEISIIRELHQHQWNNQTTIDTDYMVNHPSLNWKIRRTLNNWLVELHWKYKFYPETFFFGIHLLDLYLSKTKNVAKSILQLVGVATLFLAASYEEVDCPQVEDFIFMCNDSYTRTEFIEKVHEILCVIDYKMSFISPMVFLRRISMADDYDIPTRTVSKYLMEITILDHELIGVSSGKIAAAAYYMAIQFFPTRKWNETLSFYSHYTPDELEQTCESIKNCLLFGETYKSIHKKYSSSAFLRASLFVDNKTKAKE